MENIKGNGYISKKINDSFLAGTIPIYYEDYMTDKYINQNSSILATGEKDFLIKINYIKKIDNDYNLYKSIILKEKVLLSVNIKSEELKINLFHIFKQEKLKAYRRFL